MIAIISGMARVARGSTVGDSAPSAAMSSWKAWVVRAVTCSMVSPPAFAATMILSSTSVMLRA